VPTRRCLSHRRLIDIHSCLSSPRSLRFTRAPRVPASLRPQAAPRRPPVPYPVRVPRPHRGPDTQVPVPPGRRRRHRGRPPLPGSRRPPGLRTLPFLRYR
jgi:hypothetical protein